MHNIQKENKNNNINLKITFLWTARRLNVYQSYDLLPLMNYFVTFVHNL